MSTSVTGNINDLTGTAVTSNCYVRFWLRGCNGNQPRVGGSALIAPDNGPTYFQDFVPNGSGQISGTLYSNDVNVSAGGQVGVTWYGVQVFLNGIPGAETPYSLADGVTFNLNSAAPITTSPVVAAPTGDSTYLRKDAGNSPVTGAVQFTSTAANTFKNLEGVLFADQFAGASFDAQVAAAIAALPSTGSGTVDCRNMSNLTMAANLTISRSNTRILLGQYNVNQQTFSIIVSAGTNNVAFVGMTPIGSDTNAANKGTYFTYTGTGSSHAFGDSSATSLNHLLEGFTVDITGAGNSAVGIDSTRVYHTIMNYVRVIGKIGVTSQIGIRNNGTTTAPGSQNCLILYPYISNCFIGIQAISGAAPPLCNMNQIIGGELTGSGAGTAGSIGIDIENGNNNNLYGAVVSNYETALKIASPSNRACYGDFHSESCTNAINFTAGTSWNWLFTDSGGLILNSGTGNTVIRQNKVAIPDTMNPIIFQNALDNALNINLGSGLTTDQQANINFQNKSAVNQWTIQKQSGATPAFAVQSASGNSNILIAQDGNTVFSLNAPFGAAGAIDMNATTNAGTTGTRIWSGGSAPVQIASFGGGTTPVGNFQQPVNKVGQASITANSAGINTVETIIVKSAALAANRLVAGTHIRCTLIGTCTTTAGNTSSFLVRMGTNGTTADSAIATATTGVAGTTGTNIPFKVVIDFTVRTVGAGGTGFITATVDSNGTTGIIASTGELLIQPSMSTFNTTTASNIISFSYVSAAGTTTSTFNQAVIEVVYQ